MKKTLIILGLIALSGYVVAFASGLFLFLVSFAFASWALMTATVLAVIGLLARLFRGFSNNKRVSILAVLSAVLLAVFLWGNLDTTSPVKTKESSSSVIKSLPYLTWVQAGNEIEKSGVVRNEVDHSSSGINIYNSRNLAAAYLMNMEGKILHAWSAGDDSQTTWHHVVLDDSGDLFAIVKDEALLRLDWDSKIKWVKEMRVHHDLALADDGDIYVLSSREELVKKGGFPFPVLNDYIVRLSAEGEIKEEISLYGPLEEAVPFKRVVRIYADIIKPARFLDILKNKFRKRPLIAGYLVYDILHANTLGIMDRDVEGVGRKGDFIFCALMLDTIGTITPSGENISWSWGPGELDKPHHPTILPNGNILIFDNGHFRGYSRIIELDPRADEIAWKYIADPPEKFFSLTRGSSQRLPSGNTLVTNSDRGHVFEIDRAGEIVWEFFNPEVDRSQKTRATIYRMTRIVDPESRPWFRRLEP